LVTLPYVPALNTSCAQPLHRLAGDPHQIFAYDFMHNWCLGILLLIIGGIEAYADRMGRRDGRGKPGKKALRVLDQRLMRMPRSEGFRLPTHRQYFSKPANITANEHMAVQQVRSCKAPSCVA
jgi:hypothetical protein